MVENYREERGNKVAVAVQERDAQAREVIYAIRFVPFFFQVLPSLATS